MRHLMALGLAAIVGLGPVPARATAQVVPVVHEEMGQAWDEMLAHLGAVGHRFREHFGYGGGPGPHARPGPYGPTAMDRPLISMMLHHRGALGLSPQQVEALERVRDEFRREAIRKGADLQVAELDLERLSARSPVDLAAVEAKVREIERLRADLRLGRIRAIAEGRAQLTAEQREKLQALLSQHPHRHHERGPLHERGRMMEPGRGGSTGAWEERAPSTAEARRF